MPPDVVNPFRNVAFEITDGDAGFSTVKFEAELDRSVFNSSGMGFIRALRAYANWYLEQDRWLMVGSLREGAESLTISPAWPVSSEGVRTSRATVLF